ncbi:MAG: ABC transporter permease [Oscillospiraceae bacterium]|nr:ABC transporter permease [Oscillospiraceae bacterium]
MEGADTMNTTLSPRQQYLAQIKRRKKMVFAVQIALVLAFLLLWEVLTVIGAVDPFIFSSPSRIAQMTATMAQSDLGYHILITVLETVAGFSIGVVLGLLIAVWLWFCPFANSVAAPYLVVLNSLPKIALGPVIIVWAGAGVSAIIVMAVAISLIVTVLELSGGFASTDSALIATLKSFGADKKQVFAKVVLPANLPVLFQSLKVNIGLSLVGVIAGEFLVSKAGLGYLIVYAGQVFRMDLVMMSVIILGVIAFVMYRLVSAARQIAERKINHDT